MGNSIKLFISYSWTNQDHETWVLNLAKELVENGVHVVIDKWDLKEVEQEFRAQIEMALKNIPQLSHLTGHMLSTGFTKEVNEMVLRLAKEYHLPHSC